MAIDLRSRVMDAVVVCVDRSGLQGFSIEEVALEAGVSRASIYRHFPGGRSQLINESVTREVAAFWGELADFVRPLGDLQSRLVAGMMEARRRLIGNELLQRLLASEPDDVLPALLESDDLVHLVLVGYVKSLLERERLVDGCDVDLAAEYVVRMLLSHIATPGRWDLADRAQVERLVSTQFLGGILA